MMAEVWNNSAGGFVFSIRTDELLVVMLDWSVDMTNPDDSACLSSGLGMLAETGGVRPRWIGASVWVWVGGGGAAEVVGVLLVCNGERREASTVQLAAPSIKLDVSDGKCSRSVHWDDPSSESWLWI